MQIHGPLAAHLHAAQSVHAPHAPTAAPKAADVQATVVRDEVQISDAGRFLEQTRSLPDIRLEKVQQLREALASGTYDVDSRLDLAVSRLLDELA
jgi:flagellar biosynthesis anti-sigma factor FlgM